MSFRRFISILLILSTGLLQGCPNPSKRRSESGPAPVEARSGDGNSGSGPSSSGDGSGRGTSQSGGGNGSEEGVYEHHSVDPVKLKAYECYVRPRIRQIFNTTGDSDNALRVAEAFMKSKTWYIAPLKLKPISKEQLGFVFDESKTVQHGVQYKDEILLVKEHYDKWESQEPCDPLAPSPQGELILHEFVMLIYFMKFEKVSEICARIYKGLSMPKDNSVCQTKIDPFVPKEDIRPLNDQDYQYIRRVVTLLMANGLSATRDQVVGYFASNSFDNFIYFNPRYGSSNLPNEKINGAELAKILHEAIAARKFLPNCLYLKNAVSPTCTLDAQPESMPFLMWKDNKIVGAMGLPGLKVQVQSTNISLQFYPSLFVEQTDLPAIGRYDHLSQKSFYITGTGDLSLPRSVGQKYRSMQLILHKDETRADAKFEVMAVIFIPLVMTKVTPGVGSERPECQAVRSRSGLLSEDTVIFAASAEFQKIAELYGLSPMDANCAIQ